MCVLCMFYVDWELGGRKKLFLNKNLLGQGYRKQTTFFRPYELLTTGTFLSMSVTNVLVNTALKLPMLGLLFNQSTQM